MSLTTEITLKNNRSEDILFVIPKGQVFENKQVGTKVQNVAASREYQLIIPGNSRLSVTIDVYCINKSFSPPKGLLGNVSIYKINRPFKDQQDLWNMLSTPEEIL